MHVAMDPDICLFHEVIKPGRIRCRNHVVRMLWGNRARRRRHMSDDHRAAVKGLLKSAPQPVPMLKMKLLGVERLKLSMSIGCQMNALVVVHGLPARSDCIGMLVIPE